MPEMHSTTIIGNGNRVLATPHKNDHGLYLFLVEDSVLILQVQLIVGVVIQLIYGEIMIRQITHVITVLDGIQITKLTAKKTEETTLKGLANTGKRYIKLELLLKEQISVMKIYYLLLSLKNLVLMIVNQQYLLLIVNINVD